MNKKARTTSADILELIKIIIISIIGLFIIGTLITTLFF
jgi:hypothetical protein